MQAHNNLKVVVCTRRGCEVPDIILQPHTCVLRAY